MDYQLEYISRLFEKTSKKRIENYIITRIWHKLSDTEVKFVPQQYVKRDNEKYALTDLYLPQIRLHIEINEPAHYSSEERIEIDTKRKLEIEGKTNHSVILLDCRESIGKIHEKIDSIVCQIKEKVNQQRIDNSFIPWENGLEFTPEYHKKKGYLKVEEEPRLRTIDDVCALFGVPVPMRGYLRQGGTSHATEKDLLIWWPIESNRNWENRISENGEIIYEKNRDIEKRKVHVNRIVNENKKRIVFFHSRDALGFKFYRFKGVFQIDFELTKPEEGTVWRRIKDTIEI
jgi:hypothetical protein